MLEILACHPLLDVVKDVWEAMRGIDNLLIDLIICKVHQYPEIHPFYIQAERRTYHNQQGHPTP
jgi:hypothetical protein